VQLSLKFYKISAKGNLDEVNNLSFEDDAIYLVDDEKTLYIWFGTEVSQNLKDISIKQARILNKERGGAAKLLLMTQNREYGSFKAMMADLKEGLKVGEDVERRPELDMKVPEVVKEEKGEEITKALSDPVGWFVQNVEHRKEAIIEAAEVQLETEEQLEMEEQLEIEEKLEIEEEPIQEDPSKVDKWVFQLDERRKVGESTKPIEPKKEELVEEPIEEGEEEEEESFEESVNIKAYFASQEGLTYDELCWRLAETQLTIMKGRQNVTEDEINEKAEVVFNTMCSYDELCWLIGELETMIEKKYL